MKVIVVKPHTREFENPIILSVGDRVQIDTKRGKHWLGNVFCTLPDGHTGWAWDQAFENFDGSNEATVDQEYSSQELDVKIGEILEGYGDDGWCTNVQGETGWIPHECIEIDSADLKRRQTALIAEIEIAFASVEKGDGSGLRESAQRDLTYTHNVETLKLILAAKAQDIEPWQDLSQELLDYHFGALTWIWTDPQGFRYLMPAYMRFSLRKISENTHFAEDTVQRILEIIGRVSDWLKQMDLTVEQTRAAARFCELMLDMWVVPFNEGAYWQRNMTHQLYQTISEELSPNWFKRPV